MYCYNQDKVVLTVRDEGSGFDPKNLPHAAKDEDPVAHMLVRETLGLREGGFGIMLAKGMVDSVHYNERGATAGTSKPSSSLSSSEGMSAGSFWRSPSMVNGRRPVQSYRTADHTPLVEI